MKKFGFKRLLALFLAMTMIVGISGTNSYAADVNGDDTTSPISIKKNVYYDEKLNIMFAVDTDDLEVSKVDFKLVKGGNTVEYVTISDDPSYTYVYVAKEGVALQNIGDVYTVTVKVTDNDGNVYDKTCKYSVLEYFYERLYVSTGVSDEKIDMYEKMLAAAEAVELVVDGATTIADSVYVHVTDGTVDGVNSGGVYKEGDVLSDITANITIPDGHELVWNVEEYNAAGSQTNLASLSTEEMQEYTIPASKRVIITAETKEVGVVEKQWTLVTDVSELKAGEQIVIVAANSNVAMSTTQNSNNRGQAAVAKDSNTNTITFGDTVQIITLQEGKVSGTYAFHVGTAGYLYAASSSSNYLKTKTTLDNNGSWKIEISSAGVATIKAQGTYTRNWMRYNSQSSLFACYASGQQDICIYMLK